MMFLCPSGINNCWLVLHLLAVYTEKLQNFGDIYYFMYIPNEFAVVFVCVNGSLSRFIGSLLAIFFYNKSLVLFLYSGWASNVKLLSRFMVEAG